MDNFENDIAEILEVNSVNMNDELASFDSWDSLTMLSIIALADENYGVTLSAAEINKAQTIRGLKELIISKNGL